MSPAIGAEDPQAIGLEESHFLPGPVISHIEPVIGETAIGDMDTTLAAELSLLVGVCRVGLASENAEEKIANKRNQSITPEAGPW